jgi:signal transduction histidine kinase
MNNSNDRGQALGSSDPNHARHVGPTGPSLGAGSSTESCRPAADCLRGEGCREEFLAMVLHELRNPLGAILTATDLLRDAEDSLAQHRWVWRGVEGAARKLQCLTDDLLGLLQATQPTFQLCRRPLNFAEVAHASVERCRPAFERERLQLILRSGDQPVWVFADPVRLDFVARNLLDNAAKYSEPGGRVTVSVEDAGFQAVLRVQDRGIGIAPDVLPFIFDAFVREGVAAGRPTQGTGVGLMLVRTLVELHGGRVEASSAGRGRGSQFVVWLPTLDLSSGTREP